MQQLTALFAVSSAAREKIESSKNATGERAIKMAK
jgi:hypothetical protein